MHRYEITPGLFRGLQIGEAFHVGPLGMIYRPDTFPTLNHPANPRFRSQEASAFCRQPADLVSLVNLFNEWLRAFGEPFRLEFVDCWQYTEKGLQLGRRHEVAYALTRRAIDDGPEEGPELAPYDMERDGHYMAIFKVVRADLS